MYKRQLHLWAAAEDYYDMEIYAKLNKRDVNGRYVFNDGVTFQYSGPNAMLRASLRQLDPDKSTESEPYHTFRTPQLLERGTPVELELGFWPTSLLFHTGETLELVVAGFDYLGLDLSLIHIFIWHMHIYDIFRCPFGQDWVTFSAQRPALNELWAVELSFIHI